MKALLHKTCGSFCMELCVLWLELRGRWLKYSRRFMDDGVLFVVGKKDDARKVESSPRLLQPINN